MAARLTTYLVVAIVAATLIAGLIVGAQRDDHSGPVDLIIHNGKVHVGDKAGTIAEAVAVRGNKILRVGSERDVMRRRLPQTEIVDAKGAAVLPGFADPEASLVEDGLALAGVDLSGAETIEDVRRRLTDWADAHPDAAWITGRGWSASVFESPTHTALDLPDDTRPALLLSADGDTAWINTAAMREARITRRTAEPDDGEIVRDRRGNPTGVLKGGAIDLVRARLPQPTADERAEALRLAIADAHERGVTTIADPSASGDDLDVYQDAQKSGDLTLRVNPTVEQRTPVIKPGVPADLVVLSHDVENVSAPGVRDTPVEVTVFDGKIVYKRKPTT